MAKGYAAGIENLDMTNEMPEYEDTIDTSISEHLTMLKNLLADQKAGVSLMEFHIKKLEEKILSLNLSLNG